LEARESPETPVQRGQPAAGGHGEGGQVSVIDEPGRRAVVSQAIGKERIQTRWLGDEFDSLVLLEFRDEVPGGCCG
jgi:hypothetical protein